MENGGASVVVVTPPADVPADPVPAEVTIEAPTPAPAPDPDPEAIREAAAEAIENQRQELREELLSAEALNRLRSDTQSIRERVTSLQEQVAASQSQVAEAISSLNSNLRAVLEALTEPEETGGDPAAPPAPGNPGLELAPKPRGIWEALR